MNKAADNWISVDDKPQTMDLLLLYFLTGAYRIGYFAKDVDMFTPPNRGIDKQWGIQPSHYQSLPPPPTDKGV